MWSKYSDISLDGVEGIRISRASSLRLCLLGEDSNELVEQVLAILSQSEELGVGSVLNGTIGSIRSIHRTTIDSHHDRSERLTLVLSGVLTQDGSKTF